MAQSIDQIIASRKALYDPQRALIQQQVDQLPGQEQADVAGLETAKTNAFGDINIQANDRGLSYSGMPIAEQSRYVGERYLPALAATKANYADRRSKLQQSLLGINADEMTSAQQLQQEQVKAEQEAQARAEQLALEREKMAASERAAATRVSSKQPSAADRQASLQASFQDDLRGAFNGFATRPTFYTEKVIIPQLQVAYPELDAKKISQLVYAYRKANFGQ